MAISLIESYKSPATVAIISRDQLGDIIRQYIADSRTGDNNTLSYRETAELDSAHLVVSYTERFWQMFEAEGLVCAQAEAIEGTVEPIQYVVAEDLVAGQVCVIDADGKLQPYKTEAPAEQAELPLDDKAPDAASEFF